MDAIVRPDLTRVVLTGSESTGKTTLARQLALHYEVEYVPEFVREFAERKAAPIAMSDHGPIAHGQMAWENEYAARAGYLLFQDADLLSTVAYCNHYFGACPAWIEETAMARRPALYLLASIDVPWEADGIRDRGKRREEMHALFVETLRRLKAPYTIITGLGEARVQKAIAAVDLLLRERTL
ncbi:MAG: ATP-binding protein [Phycisphaerae bacterium]|nr:ATP-binding protein [Gemmatimonadaceae bacterium]